MTNPAEPASGYILPAGTERLIVFDGVCNLCNGLVRFIIRRDKRRRFKFRVIQPAEGASVLYVEKGQVFLKSTAILKVLMGLGGGWKLTVVLLLIPRVIRDGIYDFVAKYRYRIFGRRDACMIPRKGEETMFV